MKTRINSYAISQTRIDSAQLGVLGTIAHPMTEDAEYRGTALQDGTPIATFRLAVDSEMQNQQVDIDLASLVGFRKHNDERYKEHTFSVTSKKGYVVFYVSQGPGNFQVVLDKVGDQKAQRVFDSRILKKGDLFIATLLRPGIYEMTESQSRGIGKIKVNYPPKPGPKPYSPAPPESVSITEGGFQPAEVTTGPAQGIVFTMQRPTASVDIRLVKPDDGPRKDGETRDKVRWKNPLHVAE